MKTRSFEPVELVEAIVRLQNKHPYLPSFSEIGEELGVTRAAVSRSLSQEMADSELVQSLSTATGAAVQRTVHIRPPGEPLHLGGGIGVVVWNEDVWLLPMCVRLTPYQAGALGDWLIAYTREREQAQAG